MSKFDKILNSSDASDALLGEQIDALEQKKADNTRFKDVTPLNPISSLDSIEINTMGSTQLAAAISPSGAILGCNYVCFGSVDAGYCTLIVSRPYTGETWINVKYNAWNGWKKITVS